MTRYIAVDWSGAKSGARSKIWLAEVRDSELVRLESGRSRDEVVDELVANALNEPDMVVGLDFAFSFPRWFFEAHGLRSVEDLWRLAAERGEEWLSDCEPPFWGRPGKKKPDLLGHFRRTEIEAPKVGSSAAKSVFQIGGAGAVGTGSIRGMPYLLTLTHAGFSVWPFHECARPTVVEIYPRLLTGAVVKSNAEHRMEYLRTGFPEIPESMVALAASGEDAFDAAISAIVMSRHGREMAELEQVSNRQALMEGAIWWPRRPEAAPHIGLSSVADCPFCTPATDSIVASSRHAIALRDRYPVSDGHTLIVPREHGAALFDMSAEVVADVWSLVRRVRARLAGESAPAGFNIGVNEGAAAGQTVEHAHVHVIPRFTGDVRDPRGGVRWVVPERAPYWVGLHDDE